MKAVKGVFLMILVFTVSAPCFGNSDVIKRKKNKWLHPRELVEPANADATAGRP
ncbi:MAG: hypothetical protein LBJ47_06175 [Tannerella sp.]|nr:hypothetical protein [Tannerella sp.]